MALNVVKGGFALCAFDIVPSAMEALVAAGAVAAASPRDAAAGADVVITMLPNGSHVEEAVFGPEGLAEAISPRALFIDMSTIAPAVTDGVARRLAERGIAMLDAPVGRQQQHAVEGKLLIMAAARRPISIAPGRSWTAWATRSSIAVAWARDRA